MKNGTVWCTRFRKLPPRCARGRCVTYASRSSKTNEFLASLNQIDAEQQAKQDDSKPRFQISSLFLHECFEKLTADEREQFFFITGTEVNGVFVLNQRTHFEHESRTAMGVIAKPRSTHRLLIKLEKFGHRLLGHFHSHPGNGPGSTHPSGTDRDFQQRLEQAGHIAVAAIFFSGRLCSLFLS